MQDKFQGILDNYYVSLQINEKKILINAKDMESRYRFHKVIDQYFIDSQDVTFKANFRTPQDLFIHLTKHLSGAVIEKGVLRCSGIIGTDKMIRDVVIELQQENTETPAFGELKSAKMNEDFAEQLLERDNRIASLQKKFLELADQFRQYKRNSQKIMDGIEERLQKEEEYSKSLKERLKKSEQTVETLLAQLRNNQSKQKKELIKDEKDMAIDHHPYNSHKQYYSLTKSTANSSKITRYGGGEGWYNFLNKNEVLPKRYNKYRVTILKATQGFIMIGFCTEKGLGNKSSNENAQSVYYWGYGNGSLIEGGVKKSLSGCGAADGDVIECEADLNERKIRWTSEGQTFAECSLPTAMQGKPIYFSTILPYSCNSVSLSSL